MPANIVLLGDSIFDNAPYVPADSAVIDLIPEYLPDGYRATLVAVDGAVVGSVFDQIDRIPDDTTHLVLSVGGNNALWTAGNLFEQKAENVQAALTKVGTSISEFNREYAKLINELRELRLPLTLCTVYDNVPGLGAAEKFGLGAFNDVITKTAFSFRLPLIDLRIVCNEESDYSPVSPIEPSTSGGGKIARAIVRAVTESETSSLLYV